MHVRITQPNALEKEVPKCRTKDISCWGKEANFFVGLVCGSVDIFFRNVLCMPHWNCSSDFHKLSKARISIVSLEIISSRA